MADILDLILDWIDSGTALTKGTNLFAAELSNDDIEESVLLRATGGTQDIQQRDFEDFTMQVISRAKDLPTAETNSKLVFNFLHENKKSLHLLPNAGSPEIEIMQCWASQAPFQMPSDSKHRATYINNYSFNIKKQ
jgi:hypothetical protein